MKRRETNAVIINDTPAVIALDVKPKLDTQLQDATVTQT